MDQQQTPSFFIRGPSTFTRFIFFSTLSLLLMASDARFNYLVGVRQVLMVALQPLQVVADSPFVFYRNVQNYFVAKDSLQKQIQPLNKVVVNVGADQKAILGQAVIDATGLIGQVTRVFPYSSEVTLLTDQELSIPIQVERNGLRAIAFGSGKTGMVDLPYLPANVDIKQGDKLVTSGIDGVYPAGLAVATVESIKSNPSSPFAKVTAKPLAGVQNHRLILLIDMPAQSAVMEEIKRTVAADKEQKKKSMGVLERKP